MIIVDSTVWVDYFRGLTTPETDWLDANLERERLGLTDLILCEVLQGVKDEGSFQEVRREMLRLEIFSTACFTALREFFLAGDAGGRTSSLPLSEKLSWAGDGDRRPSGAWSAARSRRRWSASRTRQTTA